MSIEANNMTADEQDVPNNSDETQTLIGGDVFTGDSLTDAQRRVLLAAEALRGSDDLSFAEIARHADVTQTYVPEVLIDYMDRQDFRCVFSGCLANRSYETLTDLQRQVVNEIIVAQENNNCAVARQVDCSPNYVRYVSVMFHDIIEARREAICE